MTEEKKQFPGSADLPTTQKLINYWEGQFYIFIGIDDADPSFPGDNLAHFDDNGSSPATQPASDIVLQLDGPLPAGATSVWDGEIFVSSQKIKINAYR